MPRPEASLQVLRCVDVRVDLQKIVLLRPKTGEDLATVTRDEVARPAGGKVNSEPGKVLLQPHIVKIARRQGLAADTGRKGAGVVSARESCGSLDYAKAM